VISPAAVLIEKRQDQGSWPAFASTGECAVRRQTIDLGSATLLPGLIDSHTHLLLDVIVPPEAERARHFNGDFCSGAVAGDRRVAQ